MWPRVIETNDETTDEIINTLFNRFINVINIINRIYSLTLNRIFKLILFLYKMIVIKSNNPDELTSYVSEYFLLDNSIAYIHDTDEIDDEEIQELFLPSLSKNNKMILSLPLLIICENDNVVQNLQSAYELEYIDNVINIFNIDEYFHVFITSGFLPIDKSMIKLYVNKFIPEYENNEHVTKQQYQIFEMFKELGYMSRIDKFIYESTDKLIHSLQNTIYSGHIIMLKNNVKSNENISVYLSKQYIESIIEILKLIDYHIHDSVCDE